MAAPAHDIAELTKLAAQRPALKTSCAVLAEVLRGIFAEPVSESSPPLPAALARDRLTAGLPLLRGETVTLEPGALGRRWRAVCKAVEQQNSEARALADAFADLAPNSLLAEVLAGRPDTVLARAEALRLDAGLTATVLRLTIFPVLARFAADLEPLRRESAWEHGCCPTCGSWPLLGEFQGLEQVRFLRCGLCATAWQFPRLCCPFCANRDHRQLGYFHVDGEEARHRAATCELCRGYVKMISTLAPLSAPELLSADLASLHLDLAAAERGYYVGAE